MTALTNTSRAGNFPSEACSVPSTSRTDHSVSRRMRSAVSLASRLNTRLPFETILPSRQHVEDPATDDIKGDIAAVVAVQVEERQSGSELIGSGDRVAWPGRDGGRTTDREFTGPLSPASPGSRVRTIRVEDPEFAAARVCDHDPAVSEPGGIPDLKQLVGPAAFDGTDGEGRLCADLPREPGVGRGWAVLDNRNAGAVVDYRAESGVGGPARVLASGAAKGQSEDRGRETLCGRHVTHSAWIL